MDGFSENKIVVAVKAVLTYKGRALMLRRSKTDSTAPGMWEHTGGKLEFGEGLQAALLREIKEETGLEATVMKLLYAVTSMTNAHRQIVVLSYWCRAHSDAVRLSEEHDDYRWGTRVEMEKYLNWEILENLHTYKVFDTVEILPEPGKGK